MADKFEIMRLRVPLDVSNQFKTLPNGDSELYLVTITPVDGKDSKSAWKKASQLAQEGWDLVGTIPIIASSSSPSSFGELSEPNKELSYTFTNGYDLIFKRKIE